MIQYFFQAENDLELDTEMICAEDQCWDDATLKQLWEEHSVVFMTSGDGVMPVKIVGSKDHPLFVIGSEDDGAIRFKTYYGQYENTFDPYWLDSLIADLTEARNRIAEWRNG